MQPQWLTCWPLAAPLGHWVAQISGAQFPFGGRAEPVPGLLVDPELRQKQSFVKSSFCLLPPQTWRGGLQRWVRIVTLKQLILVLVTNSLLFGDSAGGHDLPKFSESHTGPGCRVLHTLLLPVLLQFGQTFSPTIPLSPLSSLWPQRPLHRSPSFWTLPSHFARWMPAHS